MSERDLLLVQLSEAESEIDRLKAELTYTKEMSNVFMDERNNLRSQLAEARAEVEELKATMPPTFKESVKTVVSHINNYYGLEG